MSILGDRIKKERENLGLTREDFAQRIGVSYSAIAMYEQGNREPNNELLSKMCNIFNCSIDYLIGNNEQRNIPTNEHSFEDVKKYYEQKINITLKNKYVNELLKLGITSSDIDNLMKIITSEDEETDKNYISLLNSLFYFWSSSYDENIINKVQDLVLLYNEEKIKILTTQQSLYRLEKQKLEKKLIDEHIDELHPSISGKSSAPLDENLKTLINYLEKNNIDNFYMTPVYGRISAGQPNWAEENIEGRIPVPMTGEIDNPEECFYLKVNGESMNKVVKNGAYALIHKQDIVEDGEIAVVLVNGYDATLKKFSKQGDFVVLEPMSDVTDDPDIKTQIYDKSTSIKILGKYIGKFELNG